MLYLSRKIGESIMIGNDIEIKLTEVKGKSAKLGLEFPSTVTVLRKEIFDDVQSQNREAMGEDVGSLEELLKSQS